MLLALKSIVWPEASGTALEAEVGAFALAGPASPAVRTGASSAGAFALVGTSAALSVGRAVVASTGAFAETGNASRAGRTAVSGTGTFALSGTAAGLSPGKRMAADTGAFVLVGLAAPAARTAGFEPGAFVLGGTTADLVPGRVLTAGPGAFTASAPEASAARTALSALGAIALTGVTADLRVSRRVAVAADSGIFTLSGAPAATARSVAGAAGAFALAGNAVRALRSGVAGLGEFALAGAAADLDYAQGVDAGVGAFALSGAAGLRVRLGLSSAVGVVLVSGEAALRLYRRQVILRPDAGRMPFGGRERGGAAGGELHPDGPGPMLEGYRQRGDIARLPWECPRGSEWTTPELRAVVLRWLSQLIARRRAAWGLSGKWAVVERAQARGIGVRRLPPDQHHLVITLRRTRGGPLEVALPFPRGEREGAALLARLALAEGSLGAIL